MNLYSHFPAFIYVKVLFPMLSKLLGVSNQSDKVGLEETRMRAATLLSKVMLMHLRPV